MQKCEIERFLIHLFSGDIVEMKKYCLEKPRRSTFFYICRQERATYVKPTVVS